MLETIIANVITSSILNIFIIQNTELYKQNQSINNENKFFFTFITLLLCCKNAWLPIHLTFIPNSAHIRDKHKSSTEA